MHLAVGEARRVVARDLAAIRGEAVEKDGPEKADFSLLHRFRVGFELAGNDQVRLEQSRWVPVVTRGAIIHRNLLSDHCPIVRPADTHCESLAKPSRRASAR